MRKIFLSLAVMVLLPVAALAQQRYALYVTAATVDASGTPIAQCQVVDVALWDGSGKWTLPTWGKPPVATAVAPIGSLQIGGIMTGQPPACP